MEIIRQFQRLCRVQIQRLLLTIGIIVFVVVLVQVTSFPYVKYASVPSNTSKNTMVNTIGSSSSTTFLNSSKTTLSFFVHGVTSSNSSNLEEETWHRVKAEGGNEEYEFVSNDDGDIDGSLEIEKDLYSLPEFMAGKNIARNKSLTVGHVGNTHNSYSGENIVELLPLVEVRTAEENITKNTDPKADIKLPKTFTSGLKYLKEDSKASVSRTTGKVSHHNATFNLEIMMVPSDSVMEKGMEATSISDMNSMLQTSVSAKSVRPRWSSDRDRELQQARWQIDNAPIRGETLGLHASLFRNVSVFVRSYELMERVLKVYVYKEGQKPIFHQPGMRGIYASEGWFMKLMEGNKKFVVRDPRRAHLFYLPFSSTKLRLMLHQQNFESHKDLEQHLKNYTDTIARKYRFWNRTNGADHFLVACHDWAQKFTKKSMGSCIRALCNSDLVTGFKIGKDVSLPVTYIRTSKNPTIDIGGNPPSERPILAFFAGGMHGYLRPILLQHWHNKVADMKILGPMSRDIEGKARYREFMKSSKFCICARGYEVHTPRIVESIHYECVPVIISDNYVPPFFEVLNWEAFAVFILEKDVPNLRNILLSIPEEKYLEMQRGVKLVQRHFLWHKKAVKYDLFHMTLHSIWHSRVFQVKPK